MTSTEYLNYLTVISDQSLTFSKNIEKTAKATAARIKFVLLVEGYRKLNLQHRLTLMKSIIVPILTHGSHRNILARKHEKHIILGYKSRN